MMERFRKTVIMLSLPAQGWKKRVQEDLRRITDIVEAYDSPAETLHEAIDRCKDADAVLAGSAIPPLPGEFFDSCASLRYLGLLSAGYDGVDVEHARKKGVVVTNAHGCTANAIAEFVFCQVLSLMRKNREMDESMRAGRFDKFSFTGTELFGKTLGVIGMGMTGRKVAEIGRGFGMKILHWSEHEEGSVDLNHLLQSSDIVTIHTAFTPEKKHMIGREEMRRMKKGAWLVNTARGALIDTEVLLEEKDRFGGLVLDTFENEPLAEKSPIRELGNSMLSPHSAFNTEESLNRIADLVIANAKAFLQGNPQNVVN